MFQCKEALSPILKERIPKSATIKAIFSGEPGRLREAVASSSCTLMNRNQTDILNNITEECNAQDKCKISSSKVTQLTYDSTNARVTT